ncbi:hypothetical protein J3459_013060 [Metarhizium acridum]|nr:hypothetical protein J3459_013060 [Metarhizium acridum]
MNNKTLNHTLVVNSRPTTPVHGSAKQRATSGDGSRTPRSHAYAVAMSLTEGWQPTAQNEAHFNMEDEKHRLHTALCSTVEGRGFLNSPQRLGKRKRRKSRRQAQNRRGMAGNAIGNGDLFL